MSNDPATAHWLGRFRESHAAGQARDHDPAFGAVFERGRGSRLWDVAGQDWIDLTCGFSASNFGHACPRLVDELSRQAATLGHLTGEPHVGRIRLAEQLLARVGWSDGGKVIFNATGARAIETAWKAATAFRPGRIARLSPGFHGRSIATAALSDTAQSPLSGAIEGQLWHAESGDYPYCARCPLGLSHPACQIQCVDAWLSRLTAEAADISCVLVEPALGARGYVFPPAEFYRRLRECTHRLGIVLIADEIQTGWGRAGGWTLSGQQGWQPDLIVLGKSLAGGLLPLSAAVGRAEILDALAAGVESETFAATPAACAVALAGIDLLERRQLFARGQCLGQQLREAITDQWKEGPRTDLLGGGVKVEGEAASCVLEFGSGAADLDAARALARAYTERCVAECLRVHWSGPVGTRVVLLPALTMSDAELQDALARLARARSAVLESTSLPESY